jgi:nitric oxide dioxygenase
LIFKAVEKRNGAGCATVVGPELLHLRRDSPVHSELRGKNMAVGTLHYLLHPPHCHLTTPWPVLFFNLLNPAHFCGNFYMTLHQIDVIKTTWKLAAANAETVGPLFYNTLFEIAPELKPMFGRTTVPEQSKKLLAMLAYVISKLDSLEDIIDEIAKLARRHVKYGVEDSHYTYVGQALLMTLEKGLGSAWNEEVKEAWATCYGVLSTAMMNAAYAEQHAA